MSSSSTALSSISITWLIAGVLLLAVWGAWHLLHDRKRKAEVQEYARVHQMRYLGDAVPKTLHLERLSMWRAGDDVENVVVGVRFGREIAIFDYHANRGKRSSRQTAVALKMSGLFDVALEVARSSDNVFVERTGEWIVYFVYKQLVAPTGLEDLVSEAQVSLSTPQCG